MLKTQLIGSYERQCTFTKYLQYSGSSSLRMIIKYIHMSFEAENFGSLVFIKADSWAACHLDHSTKRSCGRCWSE